MNRCTKCLMPDTRPGLKFTDGVCQACLNDEVLIDREERLEELKQWCKDNPECLVAVSGGKDSHFTTEMLSKFGVKYISFINVTDPFTKTDTGKHNLENLQNRFNCGLTRYTFPRLFMTAQIRKDFEDFGEPLKYLEKQIYEIPTNKATLSQMPVVFGEDPAWTYGSARHEVRPTNKFAYMGYFIPWDYKKHPQLVKNLGFHNLGDEWFRNGYIENYEQIDSYGYLIHLWMKYPKFGFQRTTDMVSRRIRQGLINLEEGKRLIEENDYKIDPKALDDFCKTLGYTENEFWLIAEGHNYAKVDLERTREQLWKERLHSSPAEPARLVTPSSINSCLMQKS